MAGGSFVGGALGTTTVASTGFFAGAVSGAGAGAVGGFINGTGNSLLAGNDFSTAFEKGGHDALYGAAFGGITGGISGGIDALTKDVNFFTGKANFDISDGVGAHNVPKDLRLLKAKYVGDFEGVNMYESAKLGSGYGSGGVTLPGQGIIVGKHTYSRAYDMGLVKHEFGHILQSRVVGYKSFYSVIGKKSIISAARHGRNGHNHNLFWTETWANKLSYEYFGSSSTWDLTRFPIGDLSFFNVLQLIAGGL